MKFVYKLCFFKRNFLPGRILYESYCRKLNLIDSGQIFCLQWGLCYTSVVTNRIHIRWKKSWIRPAEKKFWILTTASELIVDMKILIEKQTKHAWIFIWFSHRVKLRENLQKTNIIVSRWVELDPEPEYLDTPYWFCWWPWIHGQHVYPYVRLLTGHVSVVYCPSLRRKVVNCLD